MPLQYEQPNHEVPEDLWTLVLLENPYGSRLSYRSRRTACRHDQIAERGPSSISRRKSKTTIDRLSLFFSIAMAPLSCVCQI